MKIPKLVILLLLPVLSLRAATLEDFRSGILNIRGEPAINTRPLLLIIAEFEGGLTNNLRGPAYFDQLFFDQGATQSVTGFFHENSNGRFHWVKAGIAGPLKFPASEQLELLGDFRYYSNIIARVIISNAFNFKPYDLNRDGTVRSDELQIVVINNEAAASGGARTTSCVMSNVMGTDFNVCVDGNRLASINHQSSFSTIAHELTHTLGPSQDLYNSGCLNDKVTILSCTGGPDDTRTWHLDPWNKMRLGWSEPRLMLANTGGVVSLPAAHLRKSAAPVIVYNQFDYLNVTQGVDRFFIIEYRSPKSYDRNVLSDGVVVWQVLHTNKTIFPVAATGAYDNETGWGPCGKCGVFARGISNALSRCAADGGTHAADVVYRIETDASGVAGDALWRRCAKCEGLYYGPSQIVSFCPRDGLSHVQSAGTNPNYVLRTNAAPHGTQGEWFRCFKCQGLFNARTERQSGFFGSVTCPAGGNHRNTTLSGVRGPEYFMIVYDWSMFAMFPPDLRRTATTLWQSGVTTPALAFANGEITKTSIHVRPYDRDDGEITVDVLAAEDTYVDFDWVGVENGSFPRPWNTLAEGIADASWGASLKVKPGSSAETALIAKPMTISAPLGTVRIGD